jgi:hypothetical protein
MIYESIIMYINIWYINIYNVTVSHFPLSIYFDVLWKVQFTSNENLLFFLYHQQTIYRTSLSMRVTRQMSYKRQEMLTLREHPRSPPGFLLVVLAARHSFPVLCFLFCLSLSCVLCTQYCQCIWIVQSWLFLQFPLTSIYYLLYSAP